jgi:long-chain acyl-CoA synthetase
MSVHAPTTLPALLLQHAQQRPTAVALRKKHLGIWREYTWADYAQRAARVGLGLRALGVGPGDRVAIHSENRPAWLLADLGIQGIGAATVGVYPTSPAAEVEYLLSHCEARVLIAEDEEQVDKVLEVRKQLKHLTKIVVIDPRGLQGLLDDPQLMTLADLEEFGAPGALDEWSRSVAALDATDVATIVYTSGTTGPPKGAMLSHANLIAAGRIFCDAFATTSDDEVLSYLPLCHVAERLTSTIDALTVGYRVSFGEGDLPTDLYEAQPTVFLGVPRVWEKMMATVEIRMADATPLKRAMYRFWMRRGARLAPKRMQERMSVADKIVAGLGSALLYRSLRDKLGLRRTRVAISGAAPIAPQVLEFFWSLGVPVFEGYGQTEGTAVATYTPRRDVRIGQVGTALPGCDVRIADDGEILVHGPCVFLGYLNDEVATKKTVDPDGWLHTGDIGELDADGFLTITDRKKDIIITAGGKNISPSEIENRLKISPYVREAVVIGDRRPYLVALIGIEGETVGDWANRQGVGYTTYSDLTRQPEVSELIQSSVDTVNRDLAQVEMIKRIALLPKELDHEDGELTATQKVKRAAIAQQFSTLIEELYR